MEAYLSNRGAVLDEIKSALSEFLLTFNRSYMFADNMVEENENITPYVCYKTSFCSWDSQREVKLRIIVYNDKANIFMSIYRLKRDGDSKYLGSIDVFDYVEKELGIMEVNKRKVFDSYLGKSVYEKLNSFFSWIKQLDNSRLENIFKGTDWIDIPFDWRNYK